MSFMFENLKVYQRADEHVHAGLKEELEGMAKMIHGLVNGMEKRDGHGGNEASHNS